MADIEAMVAGAGRVAAADRRAWWSSSRPPRPTPAVDAARRAGFTRVGTARDLAGRLRMLVAER